MKNVIATRRSRRLTFTCLRAATEALETAASGSIVNKRPTTLLAHLDEDLRLCRKLLIETYTYIKSTVAATTIALDVRCIDHSLAHLLYWGLPHYQSVVGEGAREIACHVPKGQQTVKSHPACLTTQCCPRPRPPSSSHPCATETHFTSSFWTRIVSLIGMLLCRAWGVAGQDGYGLMRHWDRMTSLAR